MTDRAATSSTQYVSFSAVAVVVVFLWAVEGQDILFWLVLPVLWTTLFVIGLLRYGKRALWLLLVLPLAFSPVAVFTFFSYVGWMRY